MGRGINFSKEDMLSKKHDENTSQGEKKKDARHHLVHQRN